MVFTASAGQVAGQVGQVVELTDPAVSDELVVVRFGRDELPFSPADVAVAPGVRGGRSGGASRSRSAVAPEPGPEPEFVLDTPRVPAAAAGGAERWSLRRWRRSRRGGR